MSGTTGKNGTQVSVHFISNSGKGFNEQGILLNGGSTVQDLFNIKLPYGVEAGDLLIRVNRDPSTIDTVLQDGDKVTATPTNVKGAVR